MFEKSLTTVPDDPALVAGAMALLLPMRQSPMDPMEIAVRALACV